MERTRRTRQDPEAPAETTGDVSAVPDASSAGIGSEREGRIARRAYERFEERGGEHGHDLEDWLESERELENGTE
jgi:hypothetical protein